MPPPFIGFIVQQRPTEYAMDSEVAVEKLSDDSDCGAVSNLIGPHPTVVDRYFTKLYKPNVKCKGEDHCILVHSNRICIVTLAKSHPILRENKTVTDVNFEVDEKTNRRDNKVSGKRKRGAQKLQEGSILCRLTCSDGMTYIVCSCVRGSLIEVNEKLLKQPDLVTRMPQGEGYVAIVLTRLQDHEEQMKTLLSQERYNQILEQRQTESDQLSKQQTESSSVGDKKMEDEER